MKKETILVILLDDFADWESAFIAPALNKGIKPGRPTKYEIKTLSLSKDPITSIGGIKVIPDYSIDDIPANYAGLILVGGLQWFNDENLKLIPLIDNTIKSNKLVAAICNATVFLGMNGFLNNIKHTSNTINYLTECAGDAYTGKSNYINQQAVRDGKIVTANGTGYLEFCSEILFVLDADEPQYIDELYNFNKLGLIELIK